MQVCLLGNGLSSIWIDSLLGTDTRPSRGKMQFTRDGRGRHERVPGVLTDQV